MKPAPFELLRPATIDDATSLLAEAPEETVILAGGQSLVPLMNMRFVVTDRVLDLNEVRELAYVRREHGHLAVGAMTRHRTAELSEVVRRHCPLLAEAERHVGYVGIRNRGTVGGSIAHADTVAELTCVAVALGATVVLVSGRGRRELCAEEFLVANLMNAREPDEILAEIRLPVQDPGTTSGFAEFARKVGDFPLVTAAARLERDGDGCRSARLAVGGVVSTPVRIPECEALLEGADLAGGVIDDVAATAATALEPSEHPFASPEYRRVLVRVIVRRALENALKPATEEASL
jgi:CO/xanthine dehydrogenase FAD-binding subunit